MRWAWLFIQFNFLVMVESSRAQFIDNHNLVDDGPPKCTKCDLSVSPAPLQKLPVAPSATATNSPPASQKPATWEKVYKDILEPKCVACHRGRKISGGVRFDGYPVTLANVEPGHPEKSNLWNQVSHVSKQRMPPEWLGESPLSDDEVDLIKRWISEGAKGPKGAN
jgi:mono/diheme cytochrome c family protein